MGPKHSLFSLLLLNNYYVTFSNQLLLKLPLLNIYHLILLLKMYSYCVTF